MEIEYEAMFEKIDKNSMRKKLKGIGAKLIKPEFLQKRLIYKLPGNPIDKWIRLRDEGDKITLTYKQLEGGGIDSQKEIEVEVSDFEKTSKILEKAGLKREGYQENYRELWMLDGVEIVLDTWPFLDTLLEVEGKSEEEVKTVVEKLGLDYKDALFENASALYANKFGINKLDLCKIAPILKFDVGNPFIKSK